MVTHRMAKACIYCGNEARKVAKGEHIVPDALGGKPTISEFCKDRAVCNPCNNGPLSQLDTELCSRSPLSIVAAQELGKFVWQTWDVDHRADNLLLEAKPDFDAKSMSLYPQMIFEPAGLQLRGDYEELQQFGTDDFQRVFIRFALDALRAFKAGDRSRLNTKLIRLNDAIRARYRYPPRIFSRRNVNDFASKMSFEFQYLSPQDKKYALSSLEKLDASTPFRQVTTAIGSELPTVRCWYEASKVLRALAKIAINLLAALCPRTPVNRDTFRDVMRIVLGEVPVQPALIGGNGFVYASDVQPIKANGNSHSFRLLHMDGHWHVYSSFFGGRMGSFVRFWGPNREDWYCADVVVPLQSRDWAVKKWRVLQPLTVRVEWEDPAKIMPSVEMLNVKTEMQVISSSSRQGPLHR